MKILLVDDDAELLFGPTRLLEQAGFTTVTAQSGEAALDIMRANHPDLVLLDWDMPGMDGMEVCRQIRADPSFDDVLVLFFSGVYTLPKSQANGLACGADGYITRPIENHELIERIKAYARMGGRHQSPLETDR
jgi:DNA-binding response OmpR family regulator